MRINKFIAQCGVCSRRKAEELILNGMIKVNGLVNRDLSTDINLKKDIVLLNEQLIKPNQQFVYYMLYKPKGYVTTMSDDRDRKSIINLIGGIDERVYPVGRLDYETEGLLFLTNDGDLTYKLTHPKFEILKKYYVKIEGQIKESELAVIRAGVVVNGEKFNKCSAKLISFKDNVSKIEIILNEGRNREIRRIFDAIGRKVIFLKRVEVAGIKLGGLKRGEYRPLKDYEVAYLKNLVK